MIKKEFSEEDLLEEIENLKLKVAKLQKRKKYGLVWDEERVPEDICLECERKLPILNEDVKKNIRGKEDESTHLLIEGDNYHSLSVLNYTHKEKIDLIYIDPPYNTGNQKEWKYNDKYVDLNDNYRHSKWINFMSKRLKLAKNLLKPTGAICIHIDKNEFSQLKILCDEIFGEENFIENIIWRKKEGGGQQDEFLVTEHEYILFYAKKRNKFNLIEKKAEKKKESYRYFDDIKKVNYGLVKLEKWGSGALKEDRPTMHFPIKDPDGKNYLPLAPDGRLGRWRYGKIRLHGLIEEDSIEWVKRNDEWKPYEKVYEKEGDLKIIKERSIFYDYGTTGDGTNELTEIFGVKDIFQNPKPTSLISEMVSITCPKDGTVLDFFSGSGSTGHAVLKLNEIDNGKRRFILGTNNEDNNGDGKKIAEDICYPRIKKIMKGYKTPKGKKIEGLIGNLKYYKTSFVETENLNEATDEDKINLTHNTGEMIAIKEDTFEELEKTNWWQIFSGKDKVTAIYFKEDKSRLQKLVDKLEKMNKKISLYIFSWGKNEYTNEFIDYENLQVKDIPEPLIEVYKEICKL